MQRGRGLASAAYPLSLHSLTGDPPSLRNIEGDLVDNNLSLQEAASMQCAPNA